MSEASYDVFETFFHLADGAEVTRLEVGLRFWEEISTRTDLADGRLVSANRFSEDWKVWERHPAGDEIVVLLSGAIDFVVEEGATQTVHPLRGHSGIVVPRGAWHTARIAEPSMALFITRGAGTEHRPI